MLNRRNLRIKAMQTLFAYQQGRNSNQEIAWQQVEDSLEQKQKEEHRSLKTSLKQTFEDLLVGQSAESQQVPAEVLTALQESAKEYERQNQQDLRYLRKKMLEEVEGVNHLFLWILNLPIALRSFENQQLNKKKLAPDKAARSFFQANRALELLEQRLQGTSLPVWDTTDRLSQWYKELKNHSDLDEILQQPATLERDVNFLRYWFKSVLWKSNSFQDFFEEQDMGWTENQVIIKSMINKTIKSINEDGVDLAPLSYQWEEDKAFFEEIFDATLKQELWAQELISAHAKNWDLERIAEVDMILLKMALAEMIKFPSIPVKVTINEYIELSKRYSTPKSKKFINGILDVLANELVKDGTIKKSGRGLIDNK